MKTLHLFHIASIPNSATDPLACHLRELMANEDAIVAIACSNIYLAKNTLLKLFPGCGELIEKIKYVDWEELWKLEAQLIAAEISIEQKFVYGSNGILIQAASEYGYTHAQLLAETHGICQEPPLKQRRQSRSVRRNLFREEEPTPQTGYGADDEAGVMALLSSGPPGGDCGADMQPVTLPPFLDLNSADVPVEPLPHYFQLGQYPDIFFAPPPLQEKQNLIGEFNGVQYVLKRAAYSVPDNGDCGFTVLRTTRDAAIELLRQEANNSLIRQAVVAEIKAAFYEKNLPAVMQSEATEELYTNWSENQGYEAEAEFEQKLNTWAEADATYYTFIQSFHSAQGSQWLSALGGCHSEAPIGIFDAIAVAMGINGVCLWPADETDSQITGMPVHSFGDIRHGLHLLHTKQGTHYEPLGVIKVTELEYPARPAQT